MFITIKNTKQLPMADFQQQIRQKATLNIMSTPLKTNQILLDRFLTRQYSKSLKTCCFQLIERCSCYCTSQQATVMFKPQEVDQLATLITYGNQQVGGSQILRQAFSKISSQSEITTQKQPDLLQADEQQESEES